MFQLKKNNHFEKKTIDFTSDLPCVFSVTASTHKMNVMSDKYSTTVAVPVSE